MRLAQVDVVCRKLATEVNGWAPEGLLDSHHAERHPVGAAVLDNTRAQITLPGTDAGASVLLTLLSKLMDFAVDVRYDCGEGHAPLGRRMRT